MTITQVDAPNFVVNPLDMPQWIEYIAAIDTSSANPDGSFKNEGFLILDAIPRSVLKDLAGVGDGSACCRSVIGAECRIFAQ
jgi:hypothetical protein